MESGKSKRIRGVLAPVVTPFDRHFQPDAARLIRHCRWLLAQGAGLAVFGTTSEANSMSVAERRALLDALAEADLPAARMMPGTGCCALTESVELTRAAVGHGCAGVLMLPPFYYKGVSDEGLFRTYAGIIERVGDDRLRVYLYHFPALSGVAISHGLIDRLRREFPGVIAGIKDSSGDWGNMRAMIEQFGPGGFDVFCGSENFLLSTLRAGGAGCISATANINPAAIGKLDRDWNASGAEELQAKLDVVRGIVSRFPLVPAVKAVVAHFAGDDGWMTMRPPLVELDAAQRAELIGQLEASSFAMPGIAASP